MSFASRNPDSDSASTHWIPIWWLDSMGRNCYFPCFTDKATETQKICLVTQKEVIEWGSDFKCRTFSMNRVGAQKWPNYCETADWKFSTGVFSVTPRPHPGSRDPIALSPASSTTSSTFQDFRSQHTHPKAGCKGATASGKASSCFWMAGVGKAEPVSKKSSGKLRRKPFLKLGCRASAQELETPGWQQRGPRRSGE